MIQHEFIGGQLLTAFVAVCLVACESRSHRTREVIGGARGAVYADDQLLPCAPSVG